MNLRLLLFPWTDTYDVFKFLFTLIPKPMVLLEPIHMMYLNIVNPNNIVVDSTTWTDTYDVFKLGYSTDEWFYCFSWTDTYDVFK